MELTAFVEANRQDAWRGQIIVEHFRKHTGSRLGGRHGIPSAGPL